MKQFSVLLAVIGLGLCSCERHEWHTDPDEKPKSSDTINLFLHEDHSKGEHAEDGDHKAEAEHEHKVDDVHEVKKAAE